MPRSLCPSRLGFWAGAPAPDHQKTERHRVRRRRHLTLASTGSHVEVASPGPGVRHRVGALMHQARRRRATRQQPPDLSARWHRTSPTEGSSTIGSPCSGMCTLRRPDRLYLRQVASRLSALPRPQSRSRCGSSRSTRTRRGSAPRCELHRSVRSRRRLELRRTWATRPCGLRSRFGAARCSASETLPRALLPLCSSAPSKLLGLPPIKPCSLASRLNVAMACMEFLSQSHLCFWKLTRMTSLTGRTKSYRRTARFPKSGAPHVLMLDLQRRPAPRMRINPTKALPPPRKVRVRPATPTEHLSGRIQAVRPSRPKRCSTIPSNFSTPPKLTNGIGPPWWRNNRASLNSRSGSYPPSVVTPPVRNGPRRWEGQQRSPSRNRPMFPGTRCHRRVAARLARHLRIARLRRRTTFCLAWPRRRGNPILVPK